MLMVTMMTMLGHLGVDLGSFHCTYPAWTTYPGGPSDILLGLTLSHCSDMHNLSCPQSAKEEQITVAYPGSVCED